MVYLALNNYFVMKNPYILAISQCGALHLREIDLVWKWPWQPIPLNYIFFLISTFFLLLWHDFLSLLQEIDDNSAWLCGQGYGDQSEDSEECHEVTGVSLQIHRAVSQSFCQVNIFNNLFKLFSSMMPNTNVPENYLKTRKIWRIHTCQKSWSCRCCEVISSAKAKLQFIRLLAIY